MNSTPWLRPVLFIMSKGAINCAGIVMIMLRWEPAIQFWSDMHFAPHVMLGVLTFIYLVRSSLRKKTKTQ